MKNKLLPITCFACTAISGHAAVLYSQTFDSLTTGSLIGQAGFTGTTVTVETGGLSYTGGTVSVPGGSNNVTLNGTLGDNRAIINTFAAQSGTVYFSFVMTFSGNDTDDLLLFALTDDPTNLRNSGGIGINSNGGSNLGQVVGRIRGNDGSAQTTTNIGAPLGPTVTIPQFFVGSLSKVGSTNYNTLNVWVNPTTATEGSADLTITRDLGISSGLNSFLFFTGATVETTDVVKLDSIKIATTYAAVIPEPSAVLLGGLGMLVLLRRRRI
jgi:hypothetical protein